MSYRIIKVRDTPVKFPTEKNPYRAQMILMNQAWECIVTCKNAAFESPTGTGKTIAITSIALATRQWISSQYRIRLLPEETALYAEGRNEDSSATTKQNEHCVGERLLNEDDTDDFEPARVVYYERREQEGDPKGEKADRSKATLLPRLIRRDATRIPFCIFIATRTNKQASQVVKDIRRSGYPDASLCLLASRKEFCMHAEVRNSAYRNEKCRELVRKGKCCFYNNSIELGVDDKFTRGCVDIEDLCMRGHELCGCPYYGSRAAVAGVEVVVCTYNYVLDAGVRNACDIDLKGQVVIFDEAHNVEAYCRATLGWKLGVEEGELMNRAVDDMLQSWDTQNGPLDKVQPEGGTSDDSEKKVWQYLAFSTLQKLPVALAALVSKLVKPSPEDSELSCLACYKKETNTDEYLLRGEQLLAYLNASRLGHVHTNRWVKLVKFVEGQIRPEEIRECLLPPGCTDELRMAKERLLEEKNKRDNRIRSRKNEESNDEQGKRKRARKVKRNEDVQWTSKVMDLLQFATQVGRVAESVTKSSDDFVMIVQMPRQTNRKNLLDAVVRMECLNPALCLGPITEMTRSIIMMSGTLSPLDTRLSKELGIGFASMRQLPHIVNTQQNLRVLIVSRGKNNKAPMTSEHIYRQKDEVRKELMLNIIDYMKASQGGVIVFFPSYEMMTSLSTEWYQCQQFQDLVHKLGFFGTEPSSHGERLQSVIGSYCTACTTDKGALLFCVYRGKLSEGVDFHDQYCRTAILVGIPYANPSDSLVNAKTQWNDRKISNSAADGELHMSGRDWVLRHAFQAVNQAAGRVVRHRHDYGAIVLLDRRFLQIKVQSMLSEWIREGLRKTALTIGTREPTHAQAVTVLRNFFHIKNKENRN